MQTTCGINFGPSGVPPQGCALRRGSGGERRRAGETTGRNFSPSAVAGPRCFLKMSAAVALETASARRAGKLTQLRNVSPCPIGGLCVCAVCAWKVAVCVCVSVCALLSVQAVCVCGVGVQCSRVCMCGWGGGGRCVSVCVCVPCSVCRLWVCGGGSVSVFVEGVQCSCVCL